jgi:ribose transport system permease protein
MDLQAHYQTFFTGLVVIGAVLLDMYRNKRASEVRVLSPADQYRAEKLAEIKELKAAGKASEAAALRSEMSATYRRMRAEEKAELARLHHEEREAEREFQEMRRTHSHKESE